MNEALREAARQLVLQAPDLEAAPGKAFEAAMLFALAARAKADGFEVSARTAHGGKLRGDFVVRGGPGHLADPASRRRDLPCHFRVVVNRAVFELHNSLEFAGHQGSLHEVDVAAVWAADAEAACRETPRVMKGPPLVGVELKAYRFEASTAKNLVRAFFACIIDFIPTWAFRHLTLQGHGRSFELWTSQRPEAQFWFLTSAGVSEETAKFAHDNDIRLEPDVRGRHLEAFAGEMLGRLAGLSYPVPGRRAPPKPSGKRQPAPRPIRRSVRPLRKLRKLHP